MSDEPDHIDDYLTDEELAAHFNEPVPVAKEEEPFPEEEIYAVAARIKNAARKMCGANLTPTGDGLCNTQVHAVMELYRFANTLPEDKAAELKAIARKQENMPAEFLSVAWTPANHTKTAKHGITVATEEVDEKELDYKHDQFNGTVTDNPEFINAVLKAMETVNSVGPLGHPDGQLVSAKPGFLTRIKSLFS